MGWQCIPGCHGGELTPPFAPQLAEMDSDDAFQLLGNSMHLHIAMLTAAYILCCGQEVCSGDVKAKGDSGEDAIDKVEDTTSDDGDCQFVSAVQTPSKLEGQLFA